MIKVWNGEYEIAPLPNNKPLLYELLFAGNYALSIAELTGWVAYGTALGIIRDHGFIEGDTDIDFEVIGNDGIGELEDYLCRVGFELVRTSTDTEDEFVYQHCYKHKNSGVLLDFQFLKEQEGGYITEAETSGVFTYPGSIKDMIEYSVIPELILNGKGMMAIAFIRPRWYLPYVYGKDWETPITKSESKCYFKEVKDE